MGERDEAEALLDMDGRRERLEQVVADLQSGRTEPVDHATARERILLALPECEREAFLSEDRRFLRLWAWHALACSKPGYYEALEKVRAGDHSGGMMLEDVLAERGLLDAYRELLDGKPGAWERAMDNLNSARQGETVPLDQLATPQQEDALRRDDPAP